MSKLTILAILAIASVCQAKPPQKIVSGSLANVGEFPYLVSLNVNGQHTCAGSIIDSKWILTAAHCVYDSTQKPHDNIFIRAGSLSSVGGGKIYRVQNVYYHGQYRGGDASSPNDIGLIELATAIQFDHNIRPIAIATGETPAGRSARVAGWGFHYANSGQISRDLHKIDVTTIDPTSCQAYYNVILYTHQVCTIGAPGQGICQGDSGGPVVVDGKLVGIASYNIPCATGVPDVFSSAYHYTDWIKGIQNGTLKPVQQNIFGSFFQFPYWSM